MKKSSNNLKVIELLEEFTTNYQFLMQKVDNFRRAVEESYELMNKDATSLLLSGTPEKLAEFEEKHKKLYFGSHFEFEKIEENEDLSEIDMLKNRLKELEKELEFQKKDNIFMKGILEIDKQHIHNLMSSPARVINNIHNPTIYIKSIQSEEKKVERLLDIFI